MWNINDLFGTVPRDLGVITFVWGTLGTPETEAFLEEFPQFNDCTNIC